MSLGPVRSNRSPGTVQITVQKLRDVPPQRTEPDRRRQRPRLQPETEPAAAESVTASADEELRTSLFAAGGRGVVLGALRQRSHSVPHRKEVRVQLLDPEPLQTTTVPQGPPDTAGGMVGPEVGLSSGHLGHASDSATAAAAATAAAVAAAAPLIKAQSDMEARVSQLADGVQKLLHSNREGEGWGRNLSQHLEVLQSHQLQLQSQLFESALKIVTSHTSMNPDLTSATHREDAAAGSTSSHQLSSVVTGRPAPAFPVVETVPVTMETPCSDRLAEQTSLQDNHHLQGALSVSTSDGPHLQSLANESQEAVRRANDMLREMKCLKNQMTMLLKQPEDSPEVIWSAPDHLQVQQNQPQSQKGQFQPHQHQTNSQNNHRQLQSSRFKHKPNHQNMTQNLQSHENHSQKLPSHENQFPYHQSLFHPTQSHPSQSERVQRRSGGPSPLEEASQVLRQARRRKKVLDENLEVLLKANAGEILHCQLKALAANRDLTDEVRIKKTVDAWINTSTRQDPGPRHADVSSEDVGGRRPANAVTSQPRAAGRGRPLSTVRGAGRTAASGAGSRGMRSGHRPVQEAELVRATDKSTGKRPEEEDDRESYLTRLYGRVPYDGLRRTLKKSPYPRFSSSVSPLRRKPRPRLVETVRGVKLKSCETQTSLAPPLSLSPQQPHLISSSHLSPHDPTHFTMMPADSSPVATAILLGRPRMHCSLPSEPAHTTSALSASVIAVDNSAPERQKKQLNVKAPPPHLDDSAPPPRLDDRAPPPRLDDRAPPPHLDDRAPPPHLDDRAPPPHLDIFERESENEGEEDESIFPGNDHLSVADVAQVEVSQVGEEAVVLDGGPSPAPVLYHGPTFPPAALPSHPAQTQSSVLDVDGQRDALEDRLVDWVGQQLMSRVIADIYRPPLSDPAHNQHTDQSDPEERSVTSDIVEAAGGGGLQLFVDSNVSVDSELIRQLVHEVLTETLVQMLGQREAPDVGPEPGLEAPKPGPAQQEEKLVLMISTPVPTPPPSEAPPSQENTAVTTPLPSKPSSPLGEEPPQPITAPDLVATPTITPEPHPSSLHDAPPPLTWGDAELPLEEERPEEDVDPNPQQLMMSVAEEHPPFCSPPPPLPAPCPSSAVAPPCSSSFSSSSSSSPSSSSTSTVTAGTEAALKHISEGELLISVNQTEEEHICSFSSSLQELQEMDLDPPTVDQIRDQDLLTLLSRIDQDISDTGHHPNPEEEEDVSAGEVRDHETMRSLRTISPSLPDQKSFRPRIHQTAVGRHEDGGVKKMDIHLPSIRPLEEEEEEEDEEEEEEEALSAAAADTDSSTNDVF